MEDRGRASRYREISRLGAGGMARVTLAEDTLLGRLVALKRVYASGDPQGALQLKREAMVGASLNHPHLVSVYDVEIQSDGDVVIVMEYVPGNTLSDLIRASGRLSPDKALAVLRGIAAALDAIHARRIVHRDVKPANVLVSDEGVVKLADLGTADVADRTQNPSSDAVIGSFSYMAPEQIWGARPSPAMDIFALAAVAYESLSGQRARPEPNPLTLAHSITTQPPPDLRKAWPQAPVAVARLLQNGMSTDPARRPRSAGELVSRLEAALKPAERTQAHRRIALLPRPRKRDAVALAPAAAAPPPSTPLSNLTGLSTAVRTQPSHNRRKAQTESQEDGWRHRTAGRRPRPLILSSLVAVASLAAAILIFFALQASSTGAARHGDSRQIASAPTHKARDTARSTPPSHPSAPRTTPPSRSRTSASGKRPAPPPSPSVASSGPAPTEASEYGASSPTAAVEAFYEAAAHHDYRAAWALADANMRNEVQGYGAFVNQMSAVESITFHRAGIVGGSTSDAATVGLQTTAVLVDRTQRCWGTARTLRTNAGWGLDGISINCS
jgi:serine/threonine protein kinase